LVRRRPAPNFRRPDQIAHTLHRDRAEVKAVARSNLVTVAASILLAVPNVSEGRDASVIERVGAAFAPPGRDTGPPGPTGSVRLLDVHSDPHHHRSVYTLAGGLPGRTRAELRRGGVAGLAERLASGETRPDFGPAELHPRAGAVLVAAREPLVAFNLQLRAPATIDDARLVASLVREGGARGLPGVRAIAIALGGGVVQVSMNIERPLELTLAEVVEAVEQLAPVASGELVGLAPRAAFEGLSPDLPLPGFDPARHLIENALAVSDAPETH
jgi:glutamate formiminotransferase